MDPLGEYYIVKNIGNRYWFEPENAMVRLSSAIARAYTPLRLGNGVAFVIENSAVGNVVDGNSVKKYTTTDKSKDVVLAFADGRWKLVSEAGGEQVVKIASKMANIYYGYNAAVEYMDYVDLVYIDDTILDLMEATIGKRELKSTDQQQLINFVDDMYEYILNNHTYFLDYYKQFNACAADAVNLAYVAVDEVQKKTKNWAKKWKYNYARWDLDFIFYKENKEVKDILSPEYDFSKSKTRVEKQISKVKDLLRKSNIRYYKDI